MESPSIPAQGFTARTTFEAVRRELARSDEEFALRMTVYGTDALRAAIASGDPSQVIEYLSAEPESTGSERWDSLLSGQMRRHLRIARISEPAWMDPRPLRSWWFPHLASPRLIARTMQRTSADLSALGIWIDDAAFQTA